MATLSTSRMIALILAFLAAGGVALTLAIQYNRRELPVENKAATAGPVLSKPVSDAPNQHQATLPKVQAEVSALADTLVGLPKPPVAGNGIPAFDVARVDATGEAVIAGRASPGATVELLRNGEVHDHTVADQSGQFAMVPPRLPPGTYDLSLRSKRPDGTEATSKQGVAVVIEASQKDRPVAALITTDKPTVVLSQAAPPKPIAGAVVVEVVEIEPNGKLHVSGRTSPGAAVRFYLNDSFVTSATAGVDGRFAITINEGVAAGNYRVRLDEVEPSSGAVRARAEVPFNVPDKVVAASVSAQTSKPKQPDSDVAQQPHLAATTDVTLPGGGSPSTVVVPKIETTTVSRGDSLWRISRLAYGAGARYAVIYGANEDQIRNPNLIYPGQIFVLPASEARQ
jgi:nucleoid-associated protein YgaU